MSDKPLVIFDGKCGFCRIWIEYWKQLTGTGWTTPHPRTWLDASPDSAGKFGQSVQLVMPEGEVIPGARAVFTTLTYAPGMAWLLWVYEHVPGFAPVTEAALYRLIAAQRAFSITSRGSLSDATFRLCAIPRWSGSFCEILAAIYFIAFASFGVQITGLIGARGILPAGRYLPAVHETFGPQAYWIAPTVFWLAHGDALARSVAWRAP